MEIQIIRPHPLALLGREIREDRSRRVGDQEARERTRGVGEEGGVWEVGGQRGEGGAAVSVSVSVSVVRERGSPPLRW